MGTPAYMSPEQIQNPNRDHSVQQDIWALGVILYQILTGQLPFRGEHEFALLYAILHQPHVPVTQRRAGIPPALAQIVDKALQKQATARFSSMLEMLKALQQVQQQLRFMPAEMPLVAQIARKTVPANKTPAQFAGETDAKTAGLFFERKIFPHLHEAHNLMTACERL
jgi:serine/threonine-protein kinase